MFTSIKINFKKYWCNIFLCLILLLGIYLRLKGLLINPSFWHDECALAWNIKFKSSLGLFGHLRFLQVAPPLFLIITKLLTKLFGFSEIVFRFIPFLVGCLSIVGFYFLADKTLTKNHSILLAILLFAVNERLINYSFEFKPYSVDVLFTIVGLLFFMNLNLEKITLKKATSLGVLLALVPLFSFTSIFIIAGGFLYLFFKNIKSDWVKKACLSLPTIITGLIYLIFYTINNQGMNHLMKYWQNGFVTLKPMSFFSLFVESIRYLFPAAPLLLLAFILFVWGIVIYGRVKSAFYKISIASFLMLIAASLFHLYPFSDRLILFLIPIYLLLMIKPLDLISANKKIKSILIILLAIFTVYTQIYWANTFAHTSKFITKGEYARELMAILTKNAKKNDIIFVSNTSNTEFAYYSSFFSLGNQVLQEPQKSDRIKELDSIKKGSYCWFYLTSGNAQLFLNWINKNAKVINMYSDKKINNYLIYTYIK